MPAITYRQGNNANSAFLRGLVVLAIWGSALAMIGFKVYSTSESVDLLKLRQQIATELEMDNTQSLLEKTVKVEKSLSVKISALEDKIADITKKVDESIRVLETKSLSKELYELLNEVAKSNKNLANEVLSAVNLKVSAMKCKSVVLDALKNANE